VEEKLTGAHHGAEIACCCERGNYQGEGRRKPAGDGNVGSSWYNLLPKLKTVSIPTLVIYGDHDFIPAATAEHVTQALPNARMVTLKDCGHFTFLECPVADREQIDSLLRGKMKPAR
jgi:pimeloyl-ACP methyl ester carboxylesterase